MGKRGPKPGATYQKRDIPRFAPLPVTNDRELRRSQGKVDMLFNLLREIEDRQAYPLCCVDQVALDKALVAVEHLIHAMVEGCARYLFDADAAAHAPLGDRRQ